MIPKYIKKKRRNTYPITTIMYDIYPERMQDLHFTISKKKYNIN